MYYCPAYNYPDCLNQVMEWLWAVFNIGGPMSRTRIQKVSSSILGDRNRTIHWPRLFKIGIAFPDNRSPREYMEDFMERHKFTTPDECRKRIVLPSGTYFCRTVQCDEGSKIDTLSAHPDEVLRAALILGLCNSNNFNVDRPVIWTDGRLARTVELYEIGSFYDND